MKKFDLTGIVLDLDGRPTNDEKGEKFTFVKAIGMACISPNEEDTPEQKYNDFAIGVKITANPKAVELTSEEISRIKAKVGKVFGPLTVGRVWNFLEEK